MHILIILDRHLKCAADSARANNLTSLADLLDTLGEKCSALDDKLKHNLIPPLQRDAVHELLHDIQERAVDMCDNQNLSGRDTEVADLISDVEAYL